MVKSPRFLRPHTVTYVKALGEDYSGNQLTDSHYIGLVKAEVVHNSSKSNIGVENADTLLVTVDMNDYDCDVDLVVDDISVEDIFNSEVGKLKICVGDRIIFNRKEYEIESFNPISPLRNAPEFLEIRAK